MQPRLEYGILCLDLIPRCNQFDGMKTIRYTLRIEAEMFTAQTVG